MGRHRSAPTPRPAPGRDPGRRARPLSEERETMIRPRLVLALSALLGLGAAVGADAAELGGFLFAQSATVQRGTGLYLNLFKFVPVLVIFLLWTRTTAWVDDDCRELNNLKFEL